MSDLGNKEIMGTNIQRYMNNRGISRQKLADDLNVSYTTLTSWIKGDNYPRIDKIELMANYFNIEKSDLVEDKSKIDTESKNATLLAAHIDDDATEEEIQDILDYIEFKKKTRK